MHTKRTDMAAQIAANLQRELDKESGKGTFIVTNVNIRNIVTDKTLEDAIRNAAQVEFKVKQKKQERELAMADAENKRIAAEGEAKANSIIAGSITNQLIELRRIEAQAKFAGQGTHTVIMGGGNAGVMINK